MSAFKKIELSINLINHIRSDHYISSLLGDLKSISISDLINDLNSDDLKKAFWLNIYNAIFQYLSGVNTIDKKEIYKGKYLEIGGVFFSLDDIEHGILRKNKAKYSLGYLPKLSQKKILKELEVEELDYRIHFALN